MENFHKTFHDPFYCDYIKQDINSKIEEVGFNNVKSRQKSGVIRYNLSIGLSA